VISREAAKDAKKDFSHEATKKRSVANRAPQARSPALEWRFAPKKGSSSFLCCFV
jgi:hypothetical protein